MLLKLNFKENKFELLAGLIIGLAGIFWAILLTAKYYHFRYADWDLAFFNQAMWNLLHGSLYSSLFNINFLGNHANFIAFLFLPAYALFPHPLFLVYLKVAVFCLSAVPIFLIAREKLNTRWGLFIILLYFLYLPFISSIVYDFDWENLAILLIPVIFYFYEKDNFKHFVIFSLLLLSVKENMAAVVFMFGIHAFIFRKGARWGFFSLISGALWLYLSVYCFAPFFLSGSRHIYLGNYTNLVKGPAEALSSLTNPAIRNLAFRIFLPLAFVPLLSPGILLLSLPIFFQHALSFKIMEHSIARNYFATLIPLIFISLIFSLSLLRRLTKRRLSRLFLIIVTSISICTLTSLFNFYFSLRKVSLSTYQTSGFGQQYLEMIKSVPADAPVVASFIFLPELSSRANLYAFHDVYKHIHYPVSSKIPPVRYALVDFDDPYLISHLAQHPEDFKDISAFFKDNELEVVDAVNNKVMYQYRGSGRPGLLEEKIHLPKKRRKAFLINNELRLVVDDSSYRLDKQRDVPLVFYWKCLKKNKDNYGALLSLTDQYGRCVFFLVHPVGYLIKPTSALEKGEELKERINLVIPDLPAGRYILNIEFFDYNRDVEIRRLPHLEDMVIYSPKTPVFALGEITVAGRRGTFLRGR